jgi:hypothetical protein
LSADYSVNLYDHDPNYDEYVDRDAAILAAKIAAPHGGVVLFTRDYVALPFMFYFKFYQPPNSVGGYYEMIAANPETLARYRAYARTYPLFIVSDDRARAVAVAENIVGLHDLRAVGDCGRYVFYTPVGD